MLYRHWKVSGGKTMSMVWIMQIKMLSTGFRLFDYQILLRKRILIGQLKQQRKRKNWIVQQRNILTIDEGLCVQIMHFGPFDDEPATVALMDDYVEQNGYVNDMSEERLHHEIYMSDARKVAPEKWKTVIRHPIRKA